MIEALPTLWRRVAAVGLLGLLVTLLWMAIVSPIVTFAQTRADDRRAGLMALSRNRTLLSEAPRIHEALVSVEKSPRWGRFYDLQTPDHALVQMEADLREIFKAPNNPISMTTHPVTTRGSLTQLAVKVTLSMSIDEWTEALSRLQAHPKLLSIEALTVQAPDYQAVDSNPALSIQVEIVGFAFTSTGTRT